MAVPALPDQGDERQNRPGPLAPSSIEPACRADLTVLARLAAVTTADTPTARWLIPNPRQRPAVLNAWYLLLLEQAIQHRRIDVIADRSAAAAWIDWTKQGPDLSSFLPRLTAACGKHAIMLLGYHHLLHRHRPRRAHLQLAILAGTDLGAMTGLLDHQHRRLDPAGIPTRAIADSRAQRDLLTKAGYQAGALFRPAAGPKLWPMWRPAAMPRPYTRPAASA